MESNNSIYLIDIKPNSIIHCKPADGSAWVMFKRLDGMYSHCVTEKGNPAHLYCMDKLAKNDDGTFRLMEDL